MARAEGTGKGGGKKGEGEQCGIEQINERI